MLSAYAEDHACVPKLLLGGCFDGALRRAGTGYAGRDA
jgi:O-acetyl-ADP-ribose deacetylase (regulator of RNase III)